MKRSEGGWTQMKGMKVNEVRDECDQAEVRWKWVNVVS